MPKFAVPIPYVNVFSASRFKPVDAKCKAYKFQAYDGEIRIIEARFLISVEQLEDNLWRVSHLSHLPYVTVPSAGTSDDFVDFVEVPVKTGSLHINPRFYPQHPMEVL